MAKNQENIDVKRAETSPSPVQQTDSLIPLVDIYEKDDNTVITAELPGVKPENLDLRVDKGVLTIAAQSNIDVAPAQPGKDFTPTYLDFSGGQFFRAFALGDEVDRDSIQAELKEGVLTVTLPRAPQAKTRKIEIKG